MNDNEIVQCKVVGFQEYGMFVSCNDYDGLVHISEISDQYIENISDIFSVDDDVELLILEVYNESKRLKLSYKACHIINKRIIKNVSIKIGFHSLNNYLENWVTKKKKELEDL